jgi:ketol-acid reductoisomerase
MNQKSITIIGYGNQAKAWAENLADSSWNVTIALREGSPSIEKVQNNPKLSFKLVSDITDSFVALLTPDHTHLETFQSNDFFDGTTFLYAHGYSLQTSKIAEEFTQYNHILLAPKAIGTKVRENYLKGIGLAGVYSFELCDDEKVQQKVFQISQDLGIKAFHSCTIKQEVIADLFSEQSILCSLLPYAANTSFNKLVDQGIPKELAYFECWHELKLIVDTMVELGPKAFFEKISPNALLGAEKGQRKLLDDHFNENMNNLLKDIQSGHFYNEINETNFNELNSDMSDYWATQPIQQCHDKISRELNGE